MVWWFVAGAFLLLAVHPFVTYPISLFVAAKLYRAKRVVKAWDEPAEVAILFCAYNEEAVIEEKLQNCVALCEASTNAGVYVYTDGCSDRTVEIVKRFGDRVCLIEGLTRRGKSAGMNQLADAARQRGAEILFFTDANVLLDPDALTAMRQEFTDQSVGCVTGHLDYINPEESATASVGARYWSLDSLIKQLETSSGSCVGADGSIFGIRARMFRPVPENIIDDFFTSMSVLCDGVRCVYSLNVVARERTATLSREEYWRKVRIACRAFNCHRLLWPQLRRLSAWNFYKYVSHKLIRWLTAFWIAGALITIAGGVLSSGISWAHTGLVLLAFAVALGAIFWLPGPPWRLAKEAIIAIVATGMGVVKSLQGERFQTWSQASSTRQVMMKPKPSGLRIAFLTELFPPSVGGQEIRFAELANALALRGHTIQVLCVKHAVDLPTHEQLSPGVTVLRQPFVEGYRRAQGSLLPRSLVGMIGFAWATRQLLRRENFDAVFVSQWPLLHVLSLPSLARQRTVIDWCEIRDTAPYRLFQNVLPRMVKANTAVSDDVRKHIVSRSAGPVLLLPSGIARERYWGEDSATRSGVLYLGRIAHHKNVPLLVSAFDELCRRGSTQYLTIAGAGPAMDDVKAAIANSPYKARITLAGMVSEERKLELLSRSRMLVLPSQREGFPRVVAEAMASGLPTVTAIYPGNGTMGVVESFDCGLCAEPEAGALATAMEAILADWDSFSQRSSVGAVRLDWSSVVVEFEHFLAQVLDRSPVAA